MPQLSQEFRVIAFDNRGHGKSEKPHEANAYGLAMVQDVENLLDHLGLERAYIVGYSMGSAIALKFLTMHPDRVRSAVIGGSG
jgi:pimeloyl-ACP methyl ester carboxylesterase